MDRGDLEVPESRASCSDEHMACSDVVSTAETSTLLKKHDVIFIIKSLFLERKKLYMRIDVKASMKIVNS
jgi:hypothetical protein